MVEQLWPFSRNVVDDRLGCNAHHVDREIRVGYVPHERLEKLQELSSKLFFLFQHAPYCAWQLFRNGLVNSGCYPMLFDDHLYDQSERISKRRLLRQES